VLAPLWDDLILRASGVCYGVVDMAPNRKFVVEWNDTWDALDTASAHMTFELIINEAPAGQNNVVDFAYGTMARYTGFPVIGVENDDGTLATEFTSVPRSNAVLRFTPM
jgi:hypothetical protein